MVQSHLMSPPQTSFNQHSCSDFASLAYPAEMLKGGRCLAH